MVRLSQKMGVGVNMGLYFTACYSDGFIKGPPLVHTALHHCSLPFVISEVERSLISKNQYVTVVLLSRSVMLNIFVVTGRMNFSKYCAVCTVIEDKHSLLI